MLHKFLFFINIYFIIIIYYYLLFIILLFIDYRMKLIELFRNKSHDMVVLQTILYFILYYGSLLCHFIIILFSA